MSAKIHIPNDRYGGRVACRYGARPVSNRRVKPSSLADFMRSDPGSRCSECSKILNDRIKKLGKDKP